MRPPPAALRLVLAFCALAAHSMAQGTPSPVGPMTSCPQSQYLDAGECFPCNSSCATCSSPLRCSTCSPNHYRYGPMCYPCVQGCQTCVSYFCQVCQSGYLPNGRYCELIPPSAPISAWGVIWVIAGSLFILAIITVLIMAVCRKQKEAKPSLLLANPNQSVSLYVGDLSLMMVSSVNNSLYDSFHRGYSSHMAPYSPAIPLSPVNFGAPSPRTPRAPVYHHAPADNYSSHRPPSYHQAFIPLYLYTPSHLLNSPPDPRLLHKEPVQK